MSSLCHKICKNIGKKTLKFPVFMYSNLFASAAICVYILGGCKADISGVEKIWTDLTKKKVHPKTLPYPDDEDFIEKCALYFGIGGYTKDMIKNLCFVSSDYGPLFTIWTGTEALPLREDGFVGKILSTGKIHPLKEEEL